MKYVVFMCRTIKILISNWRRTRNSATYYRQGRQLLLTLLTMVTRCSHSTSNFYALIGQNLTGEFMRKIYAASWILFTLTAEADRVFLTWDQAQFSFRIVNNTPAGKAKRKQNLIQTFYETSAAHFFDWLTFLESAKQNYFLCLFFLVWKLHLRCRFHPVIWKLVIRGYMAQFLLSKLLL